MYYNQLGEKIVFVDQYSKNSFFFVYLAGVTYPNPDYSVEHNTNRFNQWENYVFEYILSGKGFISSGNLHKTVTANDFVFQNRSCRLSYRADKDQPFEKIFIVVRGRIVDKLLEAYSFYDNVIVVHNSDVRSDFEELLRLLDLCRDKSVAYRDAVLILHRILQKVCLKNGAEQSPEATGLTVAKILRNYIDNNPENIRELNDLCAYVNLSRSQVIRVFAGEFGITPMKYLIDVRIERAEYLMRMTRIPINDIASQLGFSDGRHFANAYKQRRSMTPNEYRKEWLKKNRD